MQLRQRRQSLSLIRHVYCPELKRCRAVTLATLPVGLRELPAGLAERLTPAEFEQVERLCDTNRRLWEAEQAQAAAQALPDLLLQVARWYRVQRRSAELAQRSAQARDAWSAVLAAMCTAGVGRTRQRSR